MQIFLLIDIFCLKGSTSSQPHLMKNAAENTPKRENAGTQFVVKHTVHQGKEMCRIFTLHGSLCQPTRLDTSADSCCKKHLACTSSFNPMLGWL
jgi:hypothetical protein